MKHKGEKLLARLRTGWKPIPYWSPPGKGMSIEKLLEASRIMDEADVPTEDRQIWLQVKRHKKKRLFKKLNPIWHVLGGQHA